MWGFGTKLFTYKKYEPTQIKKTWEALELPYMYVSWFQWNLKSNSAVQWSEVRIATYDELGIYGGKSLISGYTHTQCDPIFKVGNKFMAIWLITHKQKLYPFTAEDYCALNPIWHDVAKQEKCSSLKPPRDNFKKAQ